MSPGLGVAVMMNNYFHDVATALLLASGFALWVMLRRYEQDGGEAAGRYFLAMHRSMTRLARFSLAWIVLGGIPRTIFYAEFEWANAAGRMQVTALIVKHVLAVALVATGAWLWVKLGRRVAAVRARLGPEVAGAAPAPARAGGA
jgi:hypothetical protein